MSVEYMAELGNTPNIINVSINQDYQRDDFRPWVYSYFIKEFPKSEGVTTFKCIDRYSFQVEKGSLFFWKTILKNMDDLLREEYDFVTRRVGEGLPSI
jgi:hypothetical protein